MHLAAPELGILGANGIVGGGLPLAVGAAMSAQKLKNGRVTLCFFGDGASNEGTFHEALNIAASYNLPVVFICENNLYAGGAKQAAEILEKDGIHAEIIDLRTIKPMDTDTVITSVKKTNRLCCLQETWLTCSVASQISAVVAEEALEYLDAPILRIGALDAPNPFSAKLERYILPSVERIVREIREMF